MPNIIQKTSRREPGFSCLLTTGRGSVLGEMRTGALPEPHSMLARRHRLCPGGATNLIEETIKYSSDYNRVAGARTESLMEGEEMLEEPRRGTSIVLWAATVCQTLSGSEDCPKEKQKMSARSWWKAGHIYACLSPSLSLSSSPSPSPFLNLFFYSSFSSSSFSSSFFLFFFSFSSFYF